MHTTLTGSTCVIFKHLFSFVGICMSVHHLSMCLVSMESISSLELELQMVVGHRVDAGNSHTPTTIEFIHFFSKYIGW